MRSGQQNAYPYSTFCNLSKRLRDNLELALLDIKEGHACVESYSQRLRDSDNLFEYNLKEKLRLMSKRIQKIYNVEE